MGVADKQRANFRRQPIYHAVHVELGGERAHGGLKARRRIGRGRQAERDRERDHYDTHTLRCGL